MLQKSRYINFAMIVNNVKFLLQENCKEEYFVIEWIVYYHNWKKVSVSTICQYHTIYAQTENLHLELEFI